MPRLLAQAVSMLITDVDTEEEVVTTEEGIREATEEVCKFAEVSTL